MRSVLIATPALNGIHYFFRHTPTYLCVLPRHLGRDGARHRAGGLCHLPAPLDGRLQHLPPALLPPQRHERVHGPHHRRVRRQEGRFPARRWASPAVALRFRVACSTKPRVRPMRAARFGLLYIRGYQGSQGSRGMSMLFKVNSGCPPERRALLPSIGILVQATNIRPSPFDLRPTIGWMAANADRYMEQL